MLREDTQMKLSQYRSLYDVIVPKDNLLRKIKENVDFSFVNPMLREQYCENFGRPATEPEMMYKLMFLKKLYDLSDEQLVQNAYVNMAYKYFLDLDPEDGMIDSSLMTKFRKTRITEDILEEMLKETISQAIEESLIKSTAIIVDSTHTSASVRASTPTQILRDLSKQLRKEIYKSMYDLSAKFPEKPLETADLGDEIEYTKKLIENIGKEIADSEETKIQNLYHRIKDLLESDRIREIRSKDDEDARFGHKTPTSTFFGYKNHIAMTEERYISGIEVTSGEASDGRKMQILVEKSKQNGIDVKEVIGDTAFSTIDNIDYCTKNEITLIAKSNPVIANAAEPKNDGFEYNKDAGTMQCPAGELAMRAEKRVNDHGSEFLMYIFSKRKCNKCPLVNKCKVGLSKTKTYSITIISERNKERLAFQQTEYFNERLEIRYRIEEKNGELKQAHGLRTADSTGLAAMRLQTYFTAFTVNIKRFVKLMERKAAS
jgi:transposase